MRKELSVTLLGLQALSRLELVDLYSETTGDHPNEAFTDEQLLAGILEVADPRQEDVDVQDGHFVRDGKLYEVVFPMIDIPGLGRRSKLEICDDVDAQDYLIEQNCIGTVIREVKK